MSDPKLPANAIAVVGMAGRFPGAPDLDRYWANLRDGVESIARLTDADLRAAGVDPALSSRPSYVRARPVLEDIERFDARFFGISAREAALMDPQQRIFLECAWEALESAGCDPTRFPGAIGVYAGATMSTYMVEHLLGSPAAQGWPAWFQAVLGNDKDYIATRLAYALDLRGPCLTVQTACSTSLVAVHLACTSLLDGECDLALAGGVTLRLPHRAGYLYEEGALFAPDGHCRAFDAAARGTVFGNGAGVVVLRRLEDAIADGDPIRAVIRGSAVNNDGAVKVGFTAPSEAGQTRVISEALAIAGVDAGSVQYVETHGTGTPLGDPIELAALAAVFRDVPADHRCAVGSVKTNIGHLESAAGVASLIKTILALEQRQIPPSLHFTAPNPEIDLSRGPLYVNASLRTWPEGQAPRRAGVSSFGIGGTNAHVILEQAPPVAARTPAPSRALLLPLSARDPQALRDLAVAFADRLTAAADDALVDLVHTAGARRAHHAHRLAVVGHTRAELAAALLQAAEQVGDEPPPAAKPRVVFVFPGQGSQWVGMGRQLLAEEPAFRDALTAVDRALQPHLDLSLVAALAAGDAAYLERIDLVQPALFAVQVALAAVWRAWGVTPDVVVGHSMGEVAAAHIAGALTLADAARIIAVRSRLLRPLSGRGAMAVVELSMAAAAEQLTGLTDRVSLAVSNSARSTVLSGDPEVIDLLLARFTAAGIYARKVKVDVASHSPQVDPLREPLLHALRGIAPRPAAVPMLSTVHADWAIGEQLGPEYWVRNLRAPVQFARVIERLVADGDPVFVEISPHPVLLPFIDTMLRERTNRGLAVASARRDQDERANLLRAAAALYARACAVDWPRLNPVGRCVRLPAYPWQRERHWIDASRPGAARLAGAHPLLGRAFTSSAHPDEWSWEQDLDLTVAPYLADHEILGALVLPGSAFIEMALAAAEAVGAVGHALMDLAFLAPCTLSDGRVQALQTVVRTSDDGGYSMQIASARVDSGTPPTAWVVHVTGRLRPSEAPRLAPAVLTQLAARCPAVTAGPEYYAALAELGLTYGPQFQAVRQVRAGEHEALAELAAPADDAAYQLHPVLLDAAFQALLAASDGHDRRPAVLAAIERLQMHRRPGPVAWAHVRVRPRGDGEDRIADLTLVGPDGEVLVEAAGLRLRQVDPHAARRRASQPYLSLAWQAAPVPASGGRTDRWIVLAEPGPLRDVVVAALTTADQQPVPVSLAEAASTSMLLAVLRKIHAAGPCRGLVHLGALASGRVGEPSPPELDAAQTRGYGPALHAVQALASAGWRDPPRLWLVTRGLHAMVPGAAVDATQAPLWGLGRCIAHEHPELRCKRVDLGDDADVPALIHELLADDREEEVALRGPLRHVARLAPLRLSEASAPVHLRADGTYLITGGLGGLGLLTADWLRERGARHLVLLGRSAPNPAQSEAVAALERAGAAVTLVRADVADSSEITTALAGLTGPPLRGVFHAAGVLDDGLIDAQSLDRLRGVLAPKMHGAWNLHRATRDAPLDFFVLYSSIAAQLGAPGLANYVAANASLGALAHHRRALGLPAHSIEWGLFSGVGMGLKADAGARLSSRGIGNIEPAHGAEILFDVLSHEPAQVGVALLDARQWLEFYPHRAASTLLSPLLRAAGPRTAGHEHAALRAALRTGDLAERRATLERFITRQIADSLRVDPTRIERETPLKQLGVDSLLGLEIRNRLEAGLAVTLSATLIWTYPTVAGLTEHLGERLGWAPDLQPAAPPTTLDLDDLSDAELLALGERLLT